MKQQWQLEDMNAGLKQCVIGWFERYVDIKRAHLQGEPSGDDLGLLHQAQGFTRQTRQSLAVVDQSLELRGSGVDASLHAALFPQCGPSQPHPAQQGEAPRGGGQRPQALGDGAQTQQHCSHADQPRHVPEWGGQEDTVIIESVYGFILYYKI